jgi:hypothetical protein
MPHTPEPWVAEPQGAFVRIDGRKLGNGGTNLVCVVNGENRDDDAALIVASPNMKSEHRATLADLYFVEMVLSELRRAVNLDREVRVIIPTLKRVQARQAAVQAVLSQAEALS